MLRDLRVPAHRQPEEHQPDTDEREGRNRGTEQRHAACVWHRLFGDRVTDHVVLGVYVAGIRPAAVIHAGSIVVVGDIPVVISASAYNTTPFSIDARRAYDREGVVGTSGELVVLRIHGYRYDELVGVVSHALGERLTQRSPAVGYYGPVLLQRDIRVISVPDAERHATIAHGYGQVISLRRKLAVFGLYADLVYPRDPRAVGEYIYNVSRNEHVLAESRSSRQGSFLLILRLGLRRCVARRRSAVRGRGTVRGRSIIRRRTTGLAFDARRGDDNQPSGVEGGDIVGPSPLLDGL